MLLLLSPVSLVSFNANISQRFYVGNCEIVILLVVCLHCALYIVLSQSILMLHHLQILKSPFHVLPELLLRHTTFIGIDCKAHQKKIPMPALYLTYLPQPPMVKRIRIITMHLSGNIPLLASFLASHNNTLIPLRICLPRRSSCHFGWAERLIDIHPVFWLCVGVQIIQRYPFSGTESDQLRPMLVIDAAHHAEALIDGLILDRLDLRSAAILP